MSGVDSLMLLQMSKRVSLGFFFELEFFLHLTTGRTCNLSFNRASFYTSSFYSGEWLFFSNNNQKRNRTTKLGKQ